MLVPWQSHASGKPSPGQCFRQRPALSAARPGRRQVLVTAVAATSSTARADLRAKMIGSLNDTPSIGNVPEGVLEAAAELEALAKEDPVEVTEQLVSGRFEGQLNNFPGIEDGGTTLGTLTFNQFGPKELRVKLKGIELLQSFEHPGQYVTKSFFTVREGPFEGMVGVQSALGEYDLDSDKPSRQNVYFTGIRIEPKDKSSQGLQRWREALGADNPGMAEDGVCEFLFPKKIPGFRDFILLDKEYQATLGNRGSLVIVKRAPPG